MSGVSGIYPAMRQQFATAGFSWTAPGGNGIKVAILASTFAFNSAAVHLSDIDSTQIISTAPDLTSLTATNGYLGAATAAFGIIADPRIAGYLLFYQDTGTPSTSQLIAVLDGTAGDIPGLPSVLNGYDYFLYANLAYGGWIRL